MLEPGKSGNLVRPFLRSSQHDVTLPQLRSKILCMKVGVGGDHLDRRGILRGDAEEPLPKRAPTFFPDSINRGRCDKGSRKLTPIYDDPHRKGRSSLPATAETMLYVVRMPS